MWPIFSEQLLYNTQIDRYRQIKYLYLEPVCGIFTKDCGEAFSNSAVQNMSKTGFNFSPVNSEVIAS